MSSCFFIEPYDILALRGNRLFGDAGSFGDTMVMPWPSVIAGAIRSRLLVADGVDAGVFGRGEVSHPSLGTVTSPGAFTIAALNLARRTEEGVELLVPAPADLMVTKAEDEALVHRMVPRVLAPSLVTSSPTPSMATLGQDDRRKPAGDLLLRESGWRQYVSGEPVSPTNLVKSACLWGTDVRVGIGLSRDTGRPEDGKLFTTSNVVFRPGVGFVVKVQGAEIPDDVVLRLGGDGRGARLQRIPDDSWECDLARIADQRRARLVLTTPGLFEAGWLPNGTTRMEDGSLQFSLLGVTARVTSAAVPRPEIISGFDIARWTPKAAQRFAPAGSVYWLEDLEADPQALRKLVENGLWSDPPQDPHRRAEGFNRFTFALY